MIGCKLLGALDEGAKLFHAVVVFLLSAAARRLLILIAGNELVEKGENVFRGMDVGLGLLHFLEELVILAALDAANVLAKRLQAALVFPTAATCLLLEVILQLLVVICLEEGAEDGLSVLGLRS